MQQTKVAILGAGFITDIHIESYHRFVPEAEVVAVYARNKNKAKAFAEKYHIQNGMMTSMISFKIQDVKLLIFACLIFFMPKPHLKLQQRANI